MAKPTIAMSCNSLPLKAIEASTVNCELDTATKKFGSGSIKILQGGYIDVPLPSAFDMSTTLWTVEHWFNITNLEEDNYHHIINADNDINGNWAVFITNTGKVAFNIRGGAQTDSAASISNNEWHHIRITHTGNKSLKAYLDGNLFATDTFSNEPGLMRIGKTVYDNTTRWYTGNVDEFALTILNASNIAEYSGDTAPVPTEGYPDEVRSPGVVIGELFLSTSKPKAGDKGLLVNGKFFIPFAKNSEGDSGDTSAFESDAMAIIGTPVESGEEVTLSETTNYAISGTQNVVLTPITFDIAASDGSTITYAVTDGTLPDGVTLTDGMISGTPTVSGNSEVRITATSGNASLEIVLSFSIQSAAEIEYLDSSYTGALNVNITYADGTTSGNLTANRRVGGTEVRWYSNDGYCLCGSGCCNSFSIWLGSQNGL